MFNNIFKNKNIIITGHTGFKGSWLTLWLKQLGANVTGISLEPNTSPSNFTASNVSTNISDKRINLLDKDLIEKCFIEHQPDFVFHLAAQAIIKESFDDPILTWKTNVIGTLHILESLRKLKKFCCAVIITSDKCYQNTESILGYKETDPLGGSEPYSASKASAELAIHSHIKSFFPLGQSNIRIASTRAGNVIGGGDWASKRLIPDCIKAWSKGLSVDLRNPSSTRPWQHVLEPLSGYLLLASELVNQKNLHGEAFNFGPLPQNNQSVKDLVEEMSLHWSDAKWSIIDNLTNSLNESKLLKLNCSKALHSLKWEPVLKFNEMAKITIDWYKLYYDNPKKIPEMTDYQIKYYCKLANEKKSIWIK